MTSPRFFCQANPNGRLLIWDKPDDGKKYVIGADVAEGKERDPSLAQRRGIVKYADDRPDYSAAVVLEMETGNHVASWQGHIGPTDYAMVLAAMGHLYNDALLVPERNGPGVAVIEMLIRQIHYSPIYRGKVFIKADHDGLGTDMGWVTSQHTRPLLIARVEEALNSDNLFTRDASLVQELRTMEIDPQGTPRARGKNKDDRVFALALALQGRYERLHHSPTAGPREERLARLTPYERRVWKNKWAREQERDGNRNNRPAGRPRRMRRPRRLRFRP